MSTRSSKRYTFGPFEFDTHDRLLTCRGDVVPLTPKALDTLDLLIARRGHVVTKSELLEHVWPDAYVEQNNLAQNISALRKALGEPQGRPEYIETVSRRGYRFVATVTEIVTPAADAQTAMAADDASGSGSGPGLVSRSPIPETRYARSGDVNVAYQVVGDGPIDLVFVMGWVSHLEYFWTEPSFARFLNRLASFSRLILFDKRGTGLSDRVADLPTLETRMDDVRAVLQAVGSERAALLGVSEGGPMCSLFAATHPERTLALVMIGTYAKRLWAPDYPWGPKPEHAQEFYDEIRREWGGPVGLDDRAPSRLHDAAFRDWWATYLRMGASPGAALALTKMNADIDVRDVLPTIRVPTLILHRSGDRALPPDGGRYVASRIPGARFVELPGDDHLPFVGDQDALLDEIERFLTGSRHVSDASENDRVLATVLCGQALEPRAVPNSPAHRGWIERRSRLVAFAHREVERFRGRVIPQAEHALLAAFDGPARAIRCASIVSEVARRLDLSFRVGAHTGECEIALGTPQGHAVNVATHVARTASPGEVLVSRTVRDLVAGSGLLFNDRHVSIQPVPESDLALFGVSADHLRSALLSF